MFMKRFHRYCQARSYLAFWIAFVGLLGSCALLLFEIKY